MRVRHKVPAIFTLSMVDVLCCALGCVILLWLLSARQQEDESEEQARASAADLSAAREERDQAHRLLTRVAAERDRKAQGLADVLSDRTAAEALRAELRRQIRAGGGGGAALRRQLDDSRAEARGLGEKLKAASARVASLEGEVRAGGERLA